MDITSVKSESHLTKLISLLKSQGVTVYRVYRRKPDWIEVRWVERVSTEPLPAYEPKRGFAKVVKPKLSSELRTLKKQEEKEIKEKSTLTGYIEIKGNVTIHKMKR